jgi:hypothetical protein
MQGAKLPHLWIGGLSLSLIAAPAAAQEREQAPNRHPARVQEMQPAAEKALTSRPTEGIRLPQAVGEPVDPDLPMEAISETNQPRNLASNTPLDAMMVAISDGGAFPVLVFTPSAVPRVAQTPSARVAMRPAQVTPKPRVSGVQTATVSVHKAEEKTGEQGQAHGRLGVVQDPVESLDLPTGMPAIHWPEFVDGSCMGMQPGQSLYEAKKSWALAHHHVWRTYQLLEFIGASASQFRDDFWEDGYRSGDGNENWSPRAWFGPYASYRAKAIREVVEKLWDRFRTGDFDGIKIRVKCPTLQNEPNNKGNICFTWKPPAHHVVKGYVNLCEGFFDDDEEYRALIIAHEMLHHATVTWKEEQIWKSYFLGDTHLHADGNTCASGLKTEKMYGPDKTMHLANKSECWHRNIAIRNNDNYGWFIMRLGSAVRDGDLVSFPTEGTPWQTPGSTGNECSEIDVPPPGGEWQDPDDCQKIGQELVCPGGGGGGSGMVVPSTCLAAPGNLNP